MKETTNKFDEIRAYTDEELPDIIEHLINEKKFVNLLSTIYPLIPKDLLKKRLLQPKTINQFQKELVYPFLEGLVANKTTGVELLGLNNINRSSGYLYISNHRDIVIDPAFLGLKLLEKNMEAMEVAIGNNLLIYPWIEDLVRLNKAFIVKRGLTGRNALKSLQELSDYILYTIKEKKKSIWLAQREGRAKDSDDRTQVSLLKMLNLSGESDFIDNLKELNICPLSISYEYDPCDYLKAKEFQQRRDNPAFKKTPADDLASMEIGVMGYKGGVSYFLTGSINDELENMRSQCAELSKNELTEKTATLIDKKIHASYTIFKNNKIAYDILYESNRFEKEYSASDRIDFERYISKQMNKIELENKDEDFLKSKMFEIYANPLKNQLLAKE